MGKRLTYTPNGILKNALRKLWKRSRERSTALKKTGYKCSKCGEKQTMAKGKELVLEVHHLKPINWDRIFKVLREELLPEQKYLKVECPFCHSEDDEDRLLEGDER